MGLHSVGRSKISAAIFWVLLTIAVGALACGWASVHASLSEPGRSYFHELHLTLGLVGAGLIVVQLAIAAASLAFRGSTGQGGWRSGVSFALRQLAYLSFLLLVITGVGAAAFRGEQITFFGFGFPLPYLEGADQAILEALQRAHSPSAYALAAVIAANLITAGIAGFFRKREQSLPSAPALLPGSIQATVAAGVAQNFRFFGRVVFWAQFLLGLLSGLLLAFSYAGHTISPTRRGYGDPIFWASIGLSLLLVSLLLGRLYIRTARAIVAAPERYLGRLARGAFWFLGPVGFVSIIGALSSFAGVGLSVALLIGKTVSQPPGIAITDPSKIVRALDIFVLLVNVSLLFAHFVGVAVMAWLTINALRAHHQYVFIADVGSQREPPSDASA